MKEIITEIVINASKETVWNVLINFEAYPHWNPFIIGIEGEAVKDSILKNQIEMNGKVQVFKPVVEKVVPNKHFEWIGKLPLGMFIGHHCFEIVELGANQVKLIHKEEFTGWISGLLLRFIGEDTRKGFITMNKALKNQAEKMATTSLKNRAE